MQNIMRWQHDSDRAKILFEQAHQKIEIYFAFTNNMSIHKQLKLFQQLNYRIFQKSIQNDE